MVEFLHITSGTLGRTFFSDKVLTSEYARGTTRTTRLSALSLRSSTNTLIEQIVDIVREIERRVVSASPEEENAQSLTEALAAHG